MWGAILSSGFGSALGGPRVLQALAKDGLAPSFLARMSSTGQPVVATWASAAIALAAVALGGLNTVARFVTILFLTLYVAINLSAAAEKWGADPSYRPTINVPWLLSLAGSLAAVVVMFLISPLACVIAIGLELVLYVYLRQRALQRRWGDAWAGVWMSLARFALLRLKEHMDDPRNWRPNILVFVGDPEKRIGLVRLANWFSQGRGIVTASQLIEGDLTTRRYRHPTPAARDGPRPHRGRARRVRRGRRRPGVRDRRRRHGAGQRHRRPAVQHGARRLAEEAGPPRGLAAHHESPFPDPQEHPDHAAQLGAGAGSAEADRHLVGRPAEQRRHDAAPRPPAELNPEWSDSRIVVRSIARSEEEREFQEEGLQALLDEVRIEADTDVIKQPESRSIAEIIHERSAGASIVFLGMQDAAPGTEAEYAQRLDELSSGLCTTVFVRNAGEFAGKLI